MNIAYGNSATVNKPSQNSCSRLMKNQPRVLCHGSFTGLVHVVTRVF
jgi:hypothetical protein